MARTKLEPRRSERYRTLADQAPSRDSAEFLRDMAERFAREERPARLAALAAASRLPDAEFVRRFRETCDRYPSVCVDRALALAEAALADKLRPTTEDRAPRRAVRAVRPTMPGAGGAAVPASGLPPAPPAGRFANPAQALHAVLGALKVADHYGLASAVLGREVTSLGSLDREERRCVQEAAEAAADRRRAA